MPKTIYAVIIAIDDYSRAPLKGCINDALDMHDFCDQLARANGYDYIPKLLFAPNAEDLLILRDQGIHPDRYELPTRQHIIQSFSHFKQAKATDEQEDICLFYYCGHGSFQGAPEIFWGLKSGKQVETIVCVDSLMPGGRDLIDKEIAYLIWEATHDRVSYEDGTPSLHTLMIMDCCHSGDNTRSGAIEVRNRMAPPNRNTTEIRDYQGFSLKEEGRDHAQSEQSFLQALEKWRTARYVHLAAARETEIAKETTLDGQQRGVFTYSLLKTLRNGGMQLSYGELIERVKVMVRNRVDEQIPLVFSTAPEDEHLTFMGGGLKEPVTEYLVSYDEEKGIWHLHAGANAGIVASDRALGKTKLSVWRKNDERITRETEVISVGPADSVLDGSCFSSEDQQHEDWVARISRMGVPAIKVYIDEKVGSEDRKQLEEESRNEKLPTYEFVDKRTEAAYIIYHISGDFVLTKKDSNVPVFRRHPDAKVFLLALQRVGQWLRVLEMNNPETSISREDIEIEAEVVEGIRLRLDNLNTVAAVRSMRNPAEIETNFKRKKGEPDKQIQPGIRIRLKTTHQALYVACLYLDSQYGITSNLRSKEITPEGSGEFLKFSHKGKEYRTIPLSFHENYHKLGITEITDYLKVFVSTQEFPVKGLEQNELELDDKLVEIHRSSAVKGRGQGFDEEEEPDNENDWTCFTIPIKIKRPLLVQEQEVGVAGKAEVNVGGARVHVPEGFSAKVSAASAAEVKEMVEEAGSRSLSEAEALREALLPPAILWGSIPSSTAVFSRGVSSAGPDTQLSVLELTGVSGDDVINEKNPLIFEPEGGLDEEEVLISFVYDSDSGMYLPVGFSDEEGQVRIEHLPKETPGKIIGEEAITTRSLASSFKFFFKKIVIGPFNGKSNHNILALCSLGEDGVSLATPVEENALEGPDIKNICLLIHGIIGDTEGQRQSFFEDERALYKQFDAVLSYDYENLNRPIEETARLLKADLAKAGIKEGGGKRLTILAHSMGGLVSRWFIEQEGGNQVVKRLIQMGTPNGGSEVSDFRKSIFGLMGTAMNSAGVLQPYLPVLSFLGKKLSKAIFKTLDQMSPTRSEFLKKLNAEGRPKPGVPYWVIGGDTNQIQPESLDGMPLLKQYWTVFKKRAPYTLLNKLVLRTEDINDMVVTQNSMQKVPTQEHVPFQSVGCDHMSYFIFKTALDQLEEILLSEDGLTKND